MKTNEALKNEVQHALKQEPLLYATEIWVNANDGIVTLEGIVNNFAKKKEAERAAKGVHGVKTVLAKISVSYGENYKNNDKELKLAILETLINYDECLKDKLSITVENGWVTLAGELHLNFQKEKVVEAIENLTGIMGIINNIRVRSNSKSTLEKKEIEEAIANNWSLGDCSIQVQVNERRVKLTGTVKSWYQKAEAGRMAWRSQETLYVENELAVDFTFHRSK